MEITGNLVMFAILAVVILGSAVLCVTTKRIMRAATFLLFVLFGVAGLYFILDYTFLGAAQIAVYAGGITMLYIFAIALVNKRTLQGLSERMHGGMVVSGLIVTIIGMVTAVVVLLKNKFIDLSMQQADVEVPVETIGKAMVGAEKYQYVLPFEFISIFLLACIIGGLVIARKDKE